MNDSEVILNALQRERNDLHERIMQVDRIIKRIKGLDYNAEDIVPNVTQLPAEPVKAIEQAAFVFPKHANVKVQLLRVFDLLQVASKLSDVQSEYNRLIGNNNYKIRDNIRALHDAGLLKTMKTKGAGRSFLWVKNEWLIDGKLADKYKPEGFDLLHSPENITYE